MNVSFCLIALVISSALAGLLATAQSASAQQANCVQYGQLALEQQQENLQRNCGFEGPAWSDNLRGHMAWCGTVSPAEWRAELQRRAEMLQTQCGKQ